MTGTVPDKVRFGIGLFGLASISVVLWSLVWALVAPLFFGWSPIAVTSGSMEPLIATGDIVFVASSDGLDLAPGTVIVFDDAASGGRVTHRIVDVTPEGDYVTRGDANGRLDSTPVAPDQVAGVGRMVIPALGLPIVWVERGEWFLLALAVMAMFAATTASRWALLGRFSPWRTRSLVPPTPAATPAAEPAAAPGRRRRAPVLIGVALGVLAAVGVSTVQTRAAFVGATDNSADVVTADTLQPPTALLAAGGANVTLDWTITPDTYADGHAIYRGTTPGGPYVRAGTSTPHATSTYVDFPRDGAYYYVVRAAAGNWESVDSNEDSATVVGADDYDAIAPGSDNCPSHFNIDQYDTDGDGVGDACDASPTLASSGVFTSSGQTLGALKSVGVAAGDLDADGDIDLVYSTEGAANTVWLNDGSGTFTDSGQALGAGSFALALGDFDGDGDLDVTFSRKGADSVFINDGSGTFTDSGQALGTDDSKDVAVGDFDGDGDLDIAAANKGADKIWLNDGTGTFTDSGQLIGSVESRGIAVGVLDANATLDVTYSGKNDGSMFGNDGTGTVVDSGQVLDGGDAIAVDDVDADGDLDIVYSTKDPTGNTIWFNDGIGGFTAGPQDLPGDVRGLTLGDVDGDGDHDLAYAVRAAPNTVYLNDGLGTFTDSGQALDPLDSYDVAAADLDGDGDLDLAYANDGANSVWINNAGPVVGLTNSWQTGLAHTAGAGTDRMLVFVATNEQQSLTAPTLTGVTYGGQPLAFVMADEVGNGCCNARSEIWVLDEAGLAAASGTALAPTWSSAPNTPLYSHIVYDNVEQTAPFGAQTSASVIGDTPNPVPMTSVVTSSGDMVLAVAVAGEAGSYTPQNGFTLGVNQSTTTGGTTASGTAQKAATGADETVSMLFNPAAPPWTNRQVALALVLHAAP